MYRYLPHDEKIYIIYKHLTKKFYCTVTVGGVIDRVVDSACSGGWRLRVCESRDRHGGLRRHTILINV